MEINCSYSVGGNTYEGTTPKYKLDIDVGVSLFSLGLDQILEASGYELLSDILTFYQTAYYRLMIRLFLQMLK